MAGMAAGEGCQMRQPQPTQFRSWPCVRNASTYRYLGQKEVERAFREAGAGSKLRAEVVRRRKRVGTVGLDQKAWDEGKVWLRFVPDASKVDDNA
jgi:hypothetical protein